MSSKTRHLRRWLGIACAVLLLATGVTHGLGVSTVAVALTSDLSPFLGGALRAVWLAFSVTTICLGAVFFIAGLRQGSVPDWVLAVLSLIPIGSATLVYAYVGNFAGAHLLLGAGLLGLASAAIPVRDESWKPTPQE